MKIVSCRTRRIVEAVIETIENRFPEDQFMQYWVVIDPSLFPSSDEELVTFGSEAITYLAEFLGDIVDQENLEEEWMRFKFIQFPSTSLDLFKKNAWKFYQQYQTTFPQLCWLSEILLVLPVNTASVSMDSLLWE